MAIKKNRFRFGDFKLPKNFIILVPLLIVAIVIAIIMMNKNNPVKTSEPTITTSEPSIITPVPTVITSEPTVITPEPTIITPEPTVTTSTTSPLYTKQNIDSLNDLNWNLYNNIWYNPGTGVSSFPQTDINPSIYYDQTMYVVNNLTIEEGTPREVTYSNLNALECYHKIVDTINKFNADKGTGLSIPYISEKAPNAITSPTVSPLYTDANIKLLDDYNNQLKYYIVDKHWAISYELSDIIPSITFGTDIVTNYFYLWVDYGDGQTLNVPGFNSDINPLDGTINTTRFYRGAVDAINKFNDEKGTGLHINKLV